MEEQGHLPYARWRIRRAAGQHVYLYGLRDECARIVAPLAAADIQEDDGCMALWEARQMSENLAEASRGLLGRDSQVLVMSVLAYQAKRWDDNRDWLTLTVD